MSVGNRAYLRYVLFQKTVDTRIRGRYVLLEHFPLGRYEYLFLACHRKLIDFAPNGSFVIGIHFAETPIPVTGSQLLVNII